MNMKFSEFVKKYIGKKIDYDGYYGVQCVDLILCYINKVFDVKPQVVGKTGNAKEYWHQRNSKYLKSMFVPVVNSKYTVPHKGDIFVRTSGNCGHIGICTGEGSTSHFYAYEQNYQGTHEGMTKHKHTDWNTINFLRPRFQYVRAKGGLNAYKNKVLKNPSIVIPNRAEVEILKTECGFKNIKGKKYMMEQVLYKGIKYYVADLYVKVE